MMDLNSHSTYNVIGNPVEHSKSPIIQTVLGFAKYFSDQSKGLDIQRILIICFGGVAKFIIDLL